MYLVTEVIELTRKVSFSPLKLLKGSRARRDKQAFPYKHLILCVAITLLCHIWHLL